MKNLYFLLLINLIPFSGLNCMNPIPHPQGTNDLEVSSWSVIDATLRKKVSKQEADIILQADSIKASIINWNGKAFPSKILLPWMLRCVQYTICQPTMFKSNKRVYSEFLADATLVFSYGGSKAILELDYNIFKWRLLSSDGEEVCRYDLPNYEYLSLLYILYPESELIQIKYEKYIDKYEK